MNMCSRVLCIFTLLASVAWATPQKSLVSELGETGQSTATVDTGSSDPGADIDDDGWRNGDDRCQSSDLRATVFIADCDTGVANTFDINGCSLNDRIAQLVAGVNNNGELAQGIAELTRQASLPHNAQARMVACAIEADLGGPENLDLGTGNVIPGVDSDGDGFLDTADHCPYSDFADDIVIGECNTGVANRMGEYGCTLADSIEILIALSGSTSNFVGRLETFTNAALKSGLLIQSEVDRLLACGAQLDYDFNLDPAGDQDGDGVRNDVDDCPYSISHPIVVLDGCFTGVDNIAISDSCTLIDLILAEARATTDQNVFLANLADVTDGLVGEGLISRDDAAAIEQCAASFELPIDFDEGSGDGSAGDDGSGDNGPDDDDGDGVPNQDDQCAFSNTAATVVIEDCDSGVANLVLDDGCTLNDIISELANQATSHGNFVSLVTQFTNALRADGLITGAEKGAIVSCAGQSSVGGDPDDGSGDDGAGDDGSGDDGAGDDGSGDDGADAPDDRDDPNGDGQGDGQDDGSGDGQDDTPADDCEENENLPIDADPCVTEDTSGADDSSQQDEGESSAGTDLDNGRVTHGALPTKPDDDGDGVPNRLDLQPLSDLTDVVVIDGCDSGVTNKLLPNGKTLTDLFAEFTAASGHQTEFVSAVNHTIKRMQQKGQLSIRDGGLLRLCAMRTSAARGDGYGLAETDSDSDGFADAVDAWPWSNLADHLVVKGQPIPMENIALADGSTLADRMAWLAVYSADETAYGKGLAVLTQNWVRHGYITQVERSYLLNLITRAEVHPRQ